MAHHILTLKYDKTGFTPEKELRAYEGDTISFEFIIDSPNSGFRITMDKNYFSPAEVTDSRTKVTVGGLPGLSAYHCEVTSGNTSLFKSNEGKPGGGVRP